MKHGGGGWKQGEWPEIALKITQKRSIRAPPPPGERCSSGLYLWRDCKNVTLTGLCGDDRCHYCEAAQKKVDDRRKKRGREVKARGWGRCPDFCPRAIVIER